MYAPGVALQATADRAVGVQTVLAGHRPHDDYVGELPTTLAGPYKRTLRKVSTPLVL